MRNIRIQRRHLAVGCSAIALVMGAASAASAQTTTSEDAVEEVVVTGFRGSLNSALAQKKRETASVDTILAEDIGKFPDSNLAESMQRIPGVTLSRGDGGEGRTVSVRGLGPQFTRVRINGMEGTSQTGSSDIYGAGNTGRSFDFNVFPSEIFSSLQARKTAQADVEEGSLGATIDLKAPRPLDYRVDQVVTVNAKGVYNEVSKSFDPKFSILASKKFADGTFGVLASLAYQDRNIREVGYSAVDILSADTNGLNGQPFCTPFGYTPESPSSAAPPAGQSDRGADANNCNTNAASTVTPANPSTLNPRTSTLAAYNTVFNLRRMNAAGVLLGGGSGAFLPRLPRYVNSEQDSERAGGTLTLQWKPTEYTNISLDTLYTHFDVERRDNYILGLSLGRNLTNNGQPMTSIRDVAFDANGSVEYAVFDGMDVRSEGLVDQFTSEFKQVSLNFDHQFSDTFRINGLIGRNESLYRGKVRLQTFIDAIDTDGFIIDYRDGDTNPLLTFGFDVSNPANFLYMPSPDGNRTVTGGFSLQGKPSRTETVNTTMELNTIWSPTESVSVRVGGQWRESDFTNMNLNPIPGQTNTLPLPAGVTLASITRQISGLDSLWGRNAPASWAAIDPAKWADTFNFDAFQYCGIECGAGSSQIKETIKSVYGMVTFDFPDLFPIPVRGDFGARYIHTDQLAVGHIPIVAPVGAPYPSVGDRREVNRYYRDLLPSANFVLEFTPTVFGRFSAAKVMSRAELGNLTPGGSITATTRTGTLNNPLLDPIRADTVDGSLEWYFKPNSLLSVAYFYKDIKSFIQRVNTQVVYNTIGFPDALLAGSPSSPTDVFTIGRLANTPGGPLKGYEINFQTQFDFLPGPFSNFGVQANYTGVQSAINYILATSPTGTVTASTTADLVGLSRNSSSATIYYEDDRFSARLTGVNRGKYIRAIPASGGSDLQGNDKTFYLDGSASYKVTDNFTVRLEAQNLTDEQNRLFVDSVREDTLFETRIGRTITIGVEGRF